MSSQLMSLSIDSGEHMIEECSRMIEMSFKTGFDLVWSEQVVLIKIRKGEKNG